MRKAAASGHKHVTIGREAESEALLRRREEPRACAVAGLSCLRADDPMGRRPGHQSQQDAVRADHARRFHWCRRSDRDAGCGAGSQRGRAKADREPRHELVVVVPGAALAGGFRGGSGSASTLTVDDVKAIRREAPAIAKVSYLIRQPGQVQYSKPELDDENSRRQRQLPSDYKLAHRRGARPFHRMTRAERRLLH